MAHESPRAAEMTRAYGNPAGGWLFRRRSCALSFTLTERAQRTSRISKTTMAVTMRIFLSRFMEIGPAR